MKCKVCTTLMSDFELRTKLPNGTPENLCVQCKIAMKECWDGIHVSYLLPFKKDYDLIKWPSK